MTHCSSFCWNCAAFSPIYSLLSDTAAHLPGSRISQSIRGSQRSIMTHCPGIEGHWWPGLIVSAPCRPGWTESLLIYIRLILRLDTGDKRAVHMLILCPKTDWSRSTRRPAEERHYYLCSETQWHISKRHCGGWAKSERERVCVCVCVPFTEGFDGCSLHSGSSDRKVIRVDKKICTNLFQI